MILQARWMLPESSRLVAGGGLRTAQGRVVEVLSGHAAVQRARTRHGGRFLDLEEGLLAPGFVNPHAHLELSLLLQRVPAGESFTEWIGGVLAQRRNLDGAALAEGVRVGARALLGSGTTSVGDISSDPASARASRLGLRAVVYREVLDAWNPDRTAAVLAGVRRPLPARVLRSEGLSPHAPYTTSRELLRESARLARRRGLPLTVHWAETRAESDWLRSGTGAMASFLGRSPRASGLKLLEEAGLLGRSLSLAHGNHPARGEAQRVASAGCVVIHCPGTHAFFGREPFPWRSYARAGVCLALGTDSLASNVGLDMRAEMRGARAAHPGLSPAELFDMATVHAARALGFSGSVGRLRAGGAADLTLHSLAGGSPSHAADAVELALEGQTPVLASWVQGRRVL